jgi:hypothetical protein
VLHNLYAVTLSQLSIVALPQGLLADCSEQITVFLASKTISYAAKSSSAGPCCCCCTPVRLRGPALLAAGSCCCGSLPRCPPSKPPPYQAPAVAAIQLLAAAAALVLTRSASAPWMGSDRRAGLSRGAVRCLVVHRVSLHHIKLRRSPPYNSWPLLLHWC